MEDPTSPKLVPENARPPRAFSFCAITDALLARTARVAAVQVDSLSHWAATSLARAERVGVRGYDLSMEFAPLTRSALDDASASPGAIRPLPMGEVRKSAP